MPSRDVQWLIGTMVVLAALLVLAIYFGLSRLAEDIVVPLVDPDPQAVLCYEATGDSATEIIGEVEELMEGRQRLARASCVVSTLHSNRDYRRLHRSVQDILQKYPTNFDYVLVSHDLRAQRLHYSGPSE